MENYKIHSYSGEIEETTDHGTTYEEIDSDTITTDKPNEGFKELEENNYTTIEEWFENLENKSIYKSEWIYLGLITILFLLALLTRINKKK